MLLWAPSPSNYIHVHKYVYTTSYTLYITNLQQQICFKGNDHVNKMKKC